jgi:hypothetical protein
MFTDPLPNAPRVALVGPAASKLQHSAPVRERSTSTLFRASVAYADRTCNAHLIVSAFHGVLAPNAVVGPHDSTLRQLGKREREAWGVRTIGQILPSFGVAPQLVILAGQLYADALLHGAHWHNLPRPEEPLRGTAGFEARITWLQTHTPATKPATRGAP